MDWLKAVSKTSWLVKHLNSLLRRTISSRMSQRSGHRSCSTPRSSQPSNPTEIKTNKLLTLWVLCACVGTPSIKFREVTILSQYSNKNRNRKIKIGKKVSRPTSMTIGRLWIWLEWRVFPGANKSTLWVLLGITIATNDHPLKRSDCQSNRRYFPTRNPSPETLTAAPGSMSELIEALPRWPSLRSKLSRTPLQMIAIKKENYPSRCL